MQLIPYFDRFGHGQIKILTLEEMIGAQEETLNSIFRWLGLDASVAIPPVPNENMTPDIVRQHRGILNRLSAEHDLLRYAIDRIPDSIMNYGSRVFKRRINRRDVDLKAVVRGLQPLQRKQTEELSQLIGRKFPDWKTLNS
jgi:hypothetical protein